jgi:hypothetical protein
MQHRAMPSLAALLSDRQRPNSCSGSRPGLEFGLWLSTRQDLPAAEEGVNILAAFRPVKPPLKKSSSLSLQTRRLCRPCLSTASASHFYERASVMVRCEISLVEIATTTDLFTKCSGSGKKLPRPGEMNSGKKPYLQGRLPRAD